MVLVVDVGVVAAEFMEVLFLFGSLPEDVLIISSPLCSW